jgi:CubicO group peptidase (beta-lactamase class C family)
MDGHASRSIADCPAILELFDSGVQRGLHTGLQLWVSHRGKVVIDAALGDATPGEPLTPDHWLQWLSAGKPLTAIAIAQLQERGELHWDDPVIRFIPEFAAHGKDRITVRHLLTHTAGLRQVNIGWPDCEWQETLERICAAPIDPGAVPGQTPGYHVASSWFVLGEILRRVWSRPFEEVIEQQIARPCGITELRMSVLRSERQQLGSRLAPLWERTKTRLELLDWHQPPRVELPSPGSSARGPIRELGRFYESLRRALGGEADELLKRETIEVVTSRQRVGEFDLTLGHKVDFGLGVIIDSNRYGADTVPYSYGHFCSDRTFGHGGAQSSQGYCDPGHELAVAYVFNGRCGEAQHSRRCRAVNDAIHRDLGLAE